jgi:hypothetical protein
MAPLRTNDVNKAIKSHYGNKEALRTEILRRCDSDLDLLRMLGKVRVYFERTDIEERIRGVLSGDDPDVFIKFIANARDIMPDDEIRDILCRIHETHDFVFYSNASEFKVIFPNEYFSRKLSENSDFFKDNPKMFKIFLIYNAYGPLHAFGDAVQDALLSMLDTGDETPVGIDEPKNGGFACGGMDRNFYEAVERNEGVCLVNGLFLAKCFHTKGNARKLTYIAGKNQLTTDGHFLWRDFIYAPAEGQHKVILDAIEKGEKEVNIPDLIVKPVRPLRGKSNSNDLFAEFEKQNLAT